MRSRRLLLVDAARVGLERVRQKRRSTDLAYGVAFAAPGINVFSDSTIPRTPSLFGTRRPSMKDGSKKFSVGMVLGLAVGMLLYRLLLG